jgi:hypothetical protein
VLPASLDRYSLGRPWTAGEVTEYVTGCGGRIEIDDQRNEIRLWSLGEIFLNRVRSEVPAFVRVVDMGGEPGTPVGGGETWAWMSVAGVEPVGPRMVPHPQSIPIRDLRASMHAISGWVVALAAWSPPTPADHAREAFAALRHWATAPARWWRARQAARDRLHVSNITRALVGGHLGAGTGGLPVDEETP